MGDHVHAEHPIVVDLERRVVIDLRRERQARAAKSWS